jgi:hypothetical protein
MPSMRFWMAALHAHRVEEVRGCGGWFAMSQRPAAVLYEWWRLH